MRLACFLASLALTLTAVSGLVAKYTSRPVRVLVFGDSYGAVGPTYHVIQDVFKKYGVNVSVKSSAIGGTSACQWAYWDNGTSLASEARKKFPDGGPDFVWYTLGGNDLAQDATYHEVGF